MGKDNDLLEASRNGNIALVGKILDHIRKRTGPLSSFRRSPSLNGQDVNGYTALHHACLNGHSNIVLLLLAHDALPDVPDIRGSTPLYLAAWAGHHDIVKILLMHTNKPANPNAQTIDNETALHCAAQHGHNIVLSVLLSYGADPTVRNSSFQTALDLAAQFGRLQAVQILIRTHPELLEPYKFVNSFKHINNKCETPSTHIFTHTCLHLASRNGHKKVVETLLAAGVNVNILTHAGTALHEAALCGKKSVVVTLLKAGINTNSKDGNGRTVLDLLQDYPPHVTYELVLVINEFCNKNPDENQNVNDLNSENDVMRDKSHSMPKTLYEKKKNITNGNISKMLPTNEYAAKNIKPSGLSCSMSSLEQSSTKSQFYLKMKPILYQKSTNDLSTLKDTSKTNISTKNQNFYNLLKTSLDKNVNKDKNIITKKLFVPKSYEQLYLGKSGNIPSPSSSTSSRISPITRYRCVDEYVIMSDPNRASNSNSLTNSEPKQAIKKPITKKPFPSPRTFEIQKQTERADYANINYIKYTKQDAAEHSSTAKPTYDPNNNKAHSPTPEFPPPTVAEAENTIHEFMRPRSMDFNKRESIQTQTNRSIDETASLRSSTEPPSSRASDYLEEFISDVPFAGLFKGSTLNLAMDEVEYSILDRRSSGLRSPSLVRSIMKPIPAKRNLISSTSTTSNENLNENKEWDEINKIFKFIGAEVFDANGKSSNQNLLHLQDVPPLTPLSQTKFKIRKPSDLALGVSNNLSTNWCHSPNTLVYGQILYNVYYLGSTVIKVLQGTVSTRKSIQKLKRNETIIGNDLEVSLLQDCNTSTKYIKSTIEQARLEVSIAISHMGVKFIDSGNKTTICIHEIENINCVCQDTEDLRYFAYITKENDTHYCHVFMVDNLDLATEIILTLGQAFEVAYQLAMQRDATSEENELIASDCVFIDNI